MSRSSIMQDIPAQICWEYLHGGCDKYIVEDIRSIISIALPNVSLAPIMIYEIAYRIGYVKSKLASYMSETTYKKKKKWCRNTIEWIFAERSENDT